MRNMSIKEQRHLKPISAAKLFRDCLMQPTMGPMQAVSRHAAA
jgi:hypothetical protein